MSDRETYKGIASDTCLECGITPAEFNASVRSLLMELADGEGDGTFTPAQWVQAAVEVSHDYGDTCGLGRG